MCATMTTPLRPALLAFCLLLFALGVFAIEPAVATVSAKSTIADAPLFNYETRQLTDEVIAKLSAEDAKWFGTATATPRRERGFCKAFPGDDDWPSEHIWNRFNRLTDGALIPTIPLAAPCYKNFGVYNQTKCAAIAEDTEDIYTQYVKITVVSQNPLTNSQLGEPYFQLLASLPRTYVPSHR